MRTILDPLCAEKEIMIKIGLYFPDRPGTVFFGGGLGGTNDRLPNTALRSTSADFVSMEDRKTTVEQPWAFFLGVSMVGGGTVGTVAGNTLAAAPHLHD